MVTSEWKDQSRFRKDYIITSVAEVPPVEDMLLGQDTFQYGYFLFNLERPGVIGSVRTPPPVGKGYDSAIRRTGGENYLFSTTKQGASTHGVYVVAPEERSTSDRIIQTFKGLVKSYGIDTVPVGPDLYTVDKSRQVMGIGSAVSRQGRRTMRLSIGVMENEGYEKALDTSWEVFNFNVDSAMKERLKNAVLPINTNILYRNLSVQGKKQEYVAKPPKYEFCVLQRHSRDSVKTF